jgi:hypothetical protein
MFSQKQDNRVLNNRLGACLLTPEDGEPVHRECSTNEYINKEK